MYNAHTAYFEVVNELIYDKTDKLYAFMWQNVWIFAELAARQKTTLRHLRQLDALPTSKQEFGLKAKCRQVDYANIRTYHKFYKLSPTNKLNAKV